MTIELAIFYGYCIIAIAVFLIGTIYDIIHYRWQADPLFWMMCGAMWIFAIVVLILTFPFAWFDKKMNEGYEKGYERDNPSADKG